MFIYKIGYNTFEESSYNEYQHEQQFTEDQLMAIIEEALYSTYNIDVHYRGNIAEIIDDLDFQKYLLSKGFIPLKYENDISLFGWNNIVDTKATCKGVNSNKEQDMIMRLRNKIKSTPSKNKQISTMEE